MPDSIAVVHGVRDVTYAMLRHQALSLGETVSRAVCGTGLPIGVLLPNSPDFIRAVLAVWYSRNVVVPVSHLTSGEAIRRIADSLSVAMFITDGSGLERLRGFDGPSIVIEEGQVRAETTCARDSVSNPLGFSEDHAVVFLTSGTTGTPKTVGLTHDNLRCNLASASKCFPQDAYVRSYVHLPMCHSYGFTLQMLASLVRGGCLRIGGEHRLGTDLARELVASECRSLFGVPPMFRLLVDGMRRTALGPQAKRVGYIVNGAAPMTDDLLEDLRFVFPEAEICLTYGLSEASPLVTALPPKSVEEKGCSIGMAVDAVDLVLLTEDGQTTVSDGAVGEIMIRGGSVIKRYMGEHPANETSFQGGYLKTGDIARIDSDGCLYFKGRLKEMINRGGVKVYPCDVEEVLLRHGDVAEAAVVPCPHPVLGEVPFAFVRPVDGASVDPAEIRRWCAAHLAQHEVPIGFEIVDDFPRTHTGKVRKNELASVLQRRGL